MSVAAYFLMALVCGCGAFVQRVTGFGMGIFSMLFLPYIMPSHGAAVSVLGIIGTFGAAYNSIRHRKHVQMKLMLPMVCAAMVVIPLAVWLSAGMSQSVFKRLLGAVLVVLSVYFLFFSNRVHLKPTVPNALMAGAGSGILNGLFTTGGPPAVLYLIHAVPDKLGYYATLQAFFTTTNLMSTASRAVNGMITWQVLGMSAIAMVGWGLGNLLGGHVFRKLNAELLRKMIYFGMIVSGVLMML